jgi:outer membrane protein assembly factor BamB
MKKTRWQIPWDKSFVLALDTKVENASGVASEDSSRIAHATPVLFKGNDRDQLLSIAGDVVQGFDPKTGERLWSLYTQGEGLVPSPAIAGNMIFAASGFEKTTLRAIALPTKGEFNATNRIVWEQRKGVPTLPSLLHGPPHVYAMSDGGIVTCYDQASGEIIYQERVGGNHSASPVLADGRIYFLSESGETTIIQAGPEFKVLAKNPLNEKCQASLAISQGNLFIRTEKTLFCIGK